MARRSTDAAPAADRHGKLAVAVALAAFLGLIWCLYIRPHAGLFFFFPSSSSGYLVFSTFQTSYDTMSKVEPSDADPGALLAENTLLKVKLTLAERERDEAMDQLQELRPSLTAGRPFGMVTNPIVKPADAVNEELAKLLVTVAPSKELIAVIANNNVRDMVHVWVSCIKKVGVTNYLLIAVDNEIADFCRLNNIPFYLNNNATIAGVQEETGANYAISGLKFQLLREFLVLGYSVLLSDVDIVFFQNPFLHVYRDCDIEAMSDGHTNLTAYGYDDVSDDPKMGWGRYAHTMRMWVFNSGLFYIRPTIPSIELLDRVSIRLSNEKAWDQAVFNEELFFPSHPGYEGLHASKRVMDYYLFMNSKVMFTQVRKDRTFDSFRPVAVHVNYHCDKYERMVALIEYYFDGRKEALESFPDGS